MIGDFPIQFSIHKLSLTPHIFSLASELSWKFWIEGLERGRGGGPDPAIPPLFHENLASRAFFISFPNPTFLSQTNTLKSLIPTKSNECRLILLINILNLRVILKASAKRSSFLFLSMKKEHDMKVWSVVLDTCALSLIGSLQEKPRPRLLRGWHCLLRCRSQNHTLTAGHQYHKLNWVLRWLGRQQVALS